MVMGAYNTCTCRRAWPASQNRVFFRAWRDKLNSSLLYPCLNLARPSNTPSTTARASTYLQPESSFMTK